MVICLFICCLIQTLAYSDLSKTTTPLKVGVAIGEPFAFIQQNTYQGIAIDIWKLIADEDHISYQFINMGEHIDDAIEKLAKGEIDVLIGPIVPTYERTQRADFSQAYYLNQVGLVTIPVKANFLDAIASIFNRTMTIALMIFLLTFILYLHLFWYYERKFNPDINPEYLKGIAKTFWIHTLDIDLGKIPSHLRTRQFRFIWLAFVALFFSSITATLTSALTIALSDHYINYNSLDDFKNKKIAGVIATAPYDIAKEYDLNVIPVNNREDGIKLLLAGDIKAFVDYLPIADYYIHQQQLINKLDVTHVILKRDTFTFAVPINSPLRHVIDLKLRQQQKYGITKSICEKYFGSNEKYSNNCEI